MNEARNSAAHLPLLDGLRGIAAIAVMCLHVNYATGQLPGFSRAYLFVDVFFVLSGFVLTIGPVSRIKDSREQWRFIAGRIGRFWPMIFSGALLGVVATAALMKGGSFVELLAVFVMALALIPALGLGGTLFPLNVPQWSLFYELVANVAHVLLLRHLSDRSLLIAGVGSALIFLAGIITNDNGDLGATVSTFWFGFARACFAYVVGVWLGRRCWAGSTRSSVSGWTAILLLPLAAVMVLDVASLDNVWGDALFALLFVPAHFFFAVRTPAPRWATRGLTALGSLSFPLYAVHQPIVTLCANLLPPAQAALVSIGSSLIAARILMAIVETRHRAARNRATMTQSPA